MGGDFEFNIIQLKKFMQIQPKIVFPSGEMSFVYFSNWDEKFQGIFLITDDFLVDFPKGSNRVCNTGCGLSNNFWS